jgi:hypothetical protein
MDTMKPTDHSDDYVRQFLYGPGAGATVHAGGHATADVLMDERLEGWIGIPHGGISMGIMMDLAMTLDAYPNRDDLRYPVSADFRLAGTSIGIGDLLRFEVLPCPGGAEGSATVDRDPIPYMTSSIRSRLASRLQQLFCLRRRPKSPKPEKTISPLGFTR